MVQGSFVRYVIQKFWMTRYAFDNLFDGLSFGCLKQYVNVFAVNSSTFYFELYTFFCGFIIFVLTQ